MSVVVVMVAVPGPCLGVSMWHCRDCLFFAGEETAGRAGEESSRREGEAADAGGRD